MAELRRATAEEMLACLPDEMAESVGERMATDSEASRMAITTTLTTLVCTVWQCDQIKRVASVELLDDGWCVLIREDQGESMDRVRYRMDHDAQEIIGYHGHETVIAALMHALEALNDSLTGEEE